MIRSTLISLLSLLAISSAGQTLVSWNTFAQVKFHREFSKTFGFEVNVKPPEFSKELLELDGKQIRVKGYVIPVDVDLGMYMVSANPFANCFSAGAQDPKRLWNCSLTVVFPDFQQIRY